jgi:hypothetical protein
MTVDYMARQMPAGNGPDFLARKIGEAMPGTSIA